MSRGVLAGQRPPTRPPRLPSERIWHVAAEALKQGAVGIQVAKVDGGELRLSLALGTVSYTSWQALRESDPFPPGSK